MEQRPLKDYVCINPFLWLDVQTKGDCYFCCPSWLNKSIGSLSKEGTSVSDVWNSEAAQEIRSSILDGSYKYCNHQLCPHISTRSNYLVPREFIPHPDVRNAVARHLTVLEQGPRKINFSYDRSCNLACPSCRVDFFSARGEELLQLKEIQEKLLEGAKDATYVTITGSGDPFASSNFRGLLRILNRETFPSLKRVHLHTNAQLWSESTWREFESIQDFLVSAEISIDAASSETYEVNRRGGSWEKLLKNLEFISSLKLYRVALSFVVQKNNFHEIPAFSDLAGRFGFGAYYSQLVNWGTFSEEEYVSRAVHFERHPEHAQFREVLKSDRLDFPHVMIGNLAPFRARHA